MIRILNKWKLNKENIKKDGINIKINWNVEYWSIYSLMYCESNGDTSSPNKDWLSRQRWRFI